MEVHLRPETESRIQELAAKTGRAPADLVEDAMTGYLQELAEAREMIDTRYDDLKSGRLKSINGEEAFAALRRKSEARRPRASSSSTRRHAPISTKSGNTSPPTTSTPR